MRLQLLKVFYALCFCVMLVMQNFAAASEAPMIQSFDVEREGGGARLVISLERDVGFDVFLLSNPRRLVVDFQAGKFGAGFGVPEGIKARYGYFQPGQPRIVIDVGRPLGVASAFIGDGPVLNIDLTPVTQEAFEAASGWPAGAEWVPQPRAVVRADGDLIVALDPGHGGIDPGASYEGLIEKEIVLRIAKVIATRVNATPGLRAVMTREDDRFIPLRERIRIASDVGANVMISLHADSLEEGGAKGVSVYTLSNEGTDQAAEAFAERENRADILAGADLIGETDQVAKLLLELSQRATAPESDRLADAILAAVGKEFQLLQTRPHRKAAFVVLKSPDIPSVLVELGFLSSEEDRKRLQSDEYAEAIAEAVVEGLKSWQATADPAFTAPRR
ncbi:MAG: N-acetylmuramoyl-L-alanine amidase [Pseudomonadota bacterium]